MNFFKLFFCIDVHTWMWNGRVYKNNIEFFLLSKATKMVGSLQAMKQVYEDSWILHRDFCHLDHSAVAQIAGTRGNSQNFSTLYHGIEDTLNSSICVLFVQISRVTWQVSIISHNSEMFLPTAIVWLQQLAKYVIRGFSAITTSFVIIFLDSFNLIRLFSHQNVNQIWALKVDENIWTIFGESSKNFQGFGDKQIYQNMRISNVFFKNYHSLNFPSKGRLKWVAIARLSTYFDSEYIVPVEAKTGSSFLDLSDLLGLGRTANQEKLYCIIQFWNKTQCLFISIRNFNSTGWI